MFESPLVQRIELDFVTGPPTEAVKSDIGERPFPEGTKKVIVTQVALSVETREPGGENLIYRVAGDQAIFFLYQDPGEVEDGLPMWKIFEWRDMKIGAFAVELKSWGGVKSLYQ